MADRSYFAGGVGRNHDAMYGHDGSEFYVVNVNSDGKIRVISDPYVYQIAEGNISDHVGWQKIGYNADIQTAEEVVSPQGGTYVWPTGATTVTIESSDNAQDKAGGSGALAVTLYYLTTAYVEKSVTVTLTGTTPAAVCSDFFRFLNMRVSSVGTGGVPVGNLSLKSGATTYAYIRLGKTRARQPVWTVPVGKVLYILTCDHGVIHTAANKSFTMTLKATYDEKSNTVLTSGVHFMPFYEVVNDAGFVPKTFVKPLRFPAQTDIIVVGSSSGTATAECSMEGWVETA